VFASAVFFAGVIGDTLGGIVTDRIFERTGSLKRARSWMVSICMLCTLIVLVPLMLTHNLYVSMACLSAGFFFAEMTIGPMWAVPMDISPEYSGTASGMMNTGSALAAIISPVLSGYLIDAFGSWELPFAGSMLLMAIGVVLAFRMQPEARFASDTEHGAQTATRFNA
jgi:MFS transporter, ACS family, glucarate transporter